MRINLQNIKENGKKSALVISYGQILSLNIQTWPNMIAKHPFLPKFGNFYGKFVPGEELKPIFDDFSLYFED